MLSRTFRPAMFGIGVALLVTPYAASEVKAQSAWQFHLEEATIGDVHRAIRAKQITAEQLVSLYFKRIEAYNGTCVKGDIDSVTGLMLGDLTPIENAGQINAYVTLNVRGQRSKTDRADNDPKMSDALEVARAQDAYFARTGEFVGPLHGIPFAIKDNYDTVDMRTTAGAAAAYANDKGLTPAQVTNLINQSNITDPAARLCLWAGIDATAPAGAIRGDLHPGRRDRLESNWPAADRCGRPMPGAG